MARTMTAIGLMSGTSMDGVDAALIETDGSSVFRRGGFVSLPYNATMRSALAGTLGQRAAPLSVVTALTDAHVAAIKMLISETGISSENVDVIGFHGHTIFHQPANRITVQIGDGDALARQVGVDVVCDFRGADVASGGQGAPFAPLYHAALSRDLDRPLSVLNVGGIANVTWIGADDALMAFDTGPGNGLLDDWVSSHGLGDMDRDGAISAGGQADAAVLAQLMAMPYFAAPPPKSLDRLDFALDAVRGLSAADGAATLAAFTAEAVARALEFLPEAPRRWLVCGGGRHNPTLMALLQQVLQAPVEPVEAVGWRGDAIEAEAFAFLAVRSLLNLPLSVPGTTGVAAPMPGGVLHRVRAA